jgi:hypothetical protein
LWSLRICSFNAVPAKSLSQPNVRMLPRQGKAPECEADF